MITSTHTWPLIGGYSERTWSQTLVLQASSITFPQWYICLSLCDTTDANEIGEEFIHQLGQTYQHNHTTAEDLLRVLRSMSKKQPGIHMVGICVTQERLTGYSYGHAQITLWRNGVVAPILATTTKQWREISGELQEHDLLALSVYSTNPPQLLPLSSGASSSLTVELIENDLIRLHEEMDAGKAGLLLLAEAEAAADANPETVLSVPAVNPAPWWRRLFAQSRTETDEQKAHHRKILLAGWMVLAILIISVTVGARSRVNQRLERRYLELEQQVNQMIIGADALKAVDQVKARQMVRETQDQIVAAQDTFAKNEKWLTQYQSLVGKVEAYYQSIAAEVAVSEIPVWYSLSIAKPGFNGTLLTLSGENLMVLDNSSKSLVKITIPTKRADIVAGGEMVPEAMSLTMNGNRAYVLHSGGILTVSGKTVETLTERDADWQQPVLLGTFNANVYLVDGQSREIWRYSGASKQRWLGPGVQLPTQPLVSMAIDGEVWLLGKDGSVYRYRRGAPVSFETTGLDSPLGESTAIAVVSDQDTLAIMDKTHQRLVLFDKEGVYKKQIKWAGFGTAQAMVMDEAAQYAYILKDGIIYQAAL